MRRYRHTPTHPDVVAGLNDANALRGLACALDLNLEDLDTAGARQSVIHAIQILNGAAKALTP
jgi:hypothetical protein